MFEGDDLAPAETRPTVAITGASAGVGRAAARAFGRLGFNVGLIARGLDGLEAARAEVEAAGGRALILPADVAEPADVERVAARVVEELGPLDVWINAAMATVFAPVSQIRPDEFRRVTEVTYLGQVYGTMAALEHMRAEDHGTIVQVGSALGYRGIPLQAAYCGAKHAVRGFTDSLRAELEHEGSAIRLSMVQLPAVNTPQFNWARNRLPHRPQPVPPIYEPEVAAAAIVRAAAEAPREIWVGSSSLKTILGNMVAPGLLDRVLARAAYGGQQTDQPAQERPDNLFVPVPGDFGAHGRFGRRAAGSGLQPNASTVRALLLASALGFAGLAFGLGRWQGRRSR